MRITAHWLIMLHANAVVRVALRSTLLLGCLTPKLGRGADEVDCLVMNYLPYMEDVRMHQFSVLGHLPGGARVAPTQEQKVSANCTRLCALVARTPWSIRCPCPSHGCLCAAGCVLMLFCGEVWCRLPPVRWWAAWTWVATLHLPARCCGLRG